ncbi:LysE family translocator [Phreatobacter oligotrophus]|uniref:Threonine/homoserine/homoserine lactone efflux protein n=1 Tax=Phreatobacter oligotrophus TaxID=1122261 RepID=A0A2T4Z1E6_9HYPH|nr:LysE family translocator [Phreatobacter oligotrophus]PTM53532.1 threonine/homoserine/homoserine lactone efflux protein [Phreatobacter oligotrophus]
MFGIHDLWLFVLAGLLLNITPGPDMALVMARSMRDGARAGAVAALGVGAGAFVHIAAAAIGLSLIIAQSALAFAIVKWLGVAYLVVTGLRLLLARPSLAEAAAAAPPASLGAVFAQGFLTNALNPKVALFFLAFLPQFIDPAASDKALAFVVLGLVFNVNGTLVNLAVALAAARLAALSSFAVIRSRLDKVLGALFVGLGARLAFTNP